MEIAGPHAGRNAVGDHEEDLLSSIDGEWIVRRSMLFHFIQFILSSIEREFIIIYGHNRGEFCGRRRGGDAGGGKFDGDEFRRDGADGARPEPDPSGTVNRGIIISPANATTQANQEKSKEAEVEPRVFFRALRRV